MHKFGSRGLVTGYIKQLLATFNLPMTRIYTREMEEYFENNGIESPFVIESFGQLGQMIPADSGVWKQDEVLGKTSRYAQVNRECHVPYIKDNKFQIFSKLVFPDNIPNLAIIRINALEIDQIFDKEVDRIFLNF